jgi:hypothetical protein
LASFLRNISNNLQLNKKLNGGRKMNKNMLLTSILVGTLAFGGAVYAGNPGSGQAGQAGQAGQGGGCGDGFFQKIKDSFKKGYQAGKKAGTKAFDSVQNKVADSGVAIKKAITGKKPKTFVKGHYNKNGVHVKGHYRKVGKK